MNIFQSNVDFYPTPKEVVERMLMSEDIDGSALRMAGFPHHALDTYLPKLIRAGKKVAICDQLEDKKPTEKKRITELVTTKVDEPEETSEPSLFDML